LGARAATVKRSSTPAKARPRRQATATKGRAPSRSRRQPDGTGQTGPATTRLPRVLVAEDSTTQAAWLSRVLRAAGYEPLIAPDGSEALAAIATDQPDLILSDVDMPGMDGFELCRRVKEDPRLRRIPFVMVTQRDRVTDLIRALEVGADNYVTKPLDVTVLTERLGRILGEVEAWKQRSSRQRHRLGIAPEELVLSLERTQVVEMLMATAQKLEDELGTVGEIGEAITTALQLDELLPALAARVRKLSEAEVVTLAMRREEGGWRITTVEADPGTVPAQLAREAFDDALLPIKVEELRRRRSFHIRYDDDGVSSQLRALGRKYGLVDTYGWPLVVGEELIGVLGISYARHRSLSADEHRRYAHLADQAAVAVVNARLFQEERALRVQLEEALAAEREAHKNAMFMLAAAVEARDGLTGTHLRRVQAYAKALATALGRTPEEVEEIGYSSVLHDVGKLLVPDSILGKPGKLTDQEWVEMRRHPDHGDGMLTGPPFFAMARDIARCHHERWDGTGYPRGLHAEEIPIAARITSVADVFDALVTRRSYKEPWSDDDAIGEIRKLRGTSFDPAVVDAFLELWDSGQIRRIRATFAG
jgi:response regulator RpfG family c-di-GMP phosphodiesterase